MGIHFPAWSGSRKRDHLLRRYITHKINYFLDPNEENEIQFSAVIKDIEKEMRPAKFTGDHKDVRVIHKKDFTVHCALIEESYNIGIPAKSLTLYDFLSYLENIKEKKQKEGKASKQLPNVPVKP